MNQTTNLRKPKVLAVDDYSANIIALEAVLSNQYILIEANSGAEALKLLEMHDDIAVVLIADVPKFFNVYIVSNCVANCTAV